MKKLVSIIVPVYNSENYLEDCINSIINQSYSNIEIIIINDGSTDNSDKIIKSKLDKYSNFITYIKQENKGAGYTRNLALSKANGEYIAFVDSDDIIKEDYIEKLINEIDSLNYDVVCSGIKYFNDVPLSKSLYQYTILGVVSKIYRKSFLLNNNIIFSPKAFAEDAYFNLQVLLKTKKVQTIDYFGYFYRKNEQSITHTIKRRNINIHIDKILDEMYLEWEKNKEENKDKKPYIEFYFFICIGLGYLKELCKNLSFTNFKIEYDKVMNFFRKNNINYSKNELLTIKQIFKHDKNNRIIVKLFFILHKIGLGKILLWIYNKK